MLERERREFETSNSNVHNVNLRPKDIADIIPIFDPSKTSSLTATLWIERVRSIANTYDWGDATTVLHAATKLRGAARTWYNNTVENLTDWETFKDALINGFPTVINEADVHFELAAVRKNKNESYEEYFYNTIAIAKKGNLSDAAVIKYIINGMDDAEMRKTLSLMAINTPQELLLRIKQCEDRPLRNITRPETKNISKNKYSGHVMTSSPARDTCFNCGRRGHLSKNCPNQSL